MASFDTSPVRRNSMFSTDTSPDSSPGMLRRNSSMGLLHDLPTGKSEAMLEEEAMGARALLAKRIEEERLEEERLKRERLDRKKWPSAEAVAKLVEDKLLWDVPHARLRSFLKEQGVPAQNLLSANWFWLRVEAIRYKIDLEPLRIEMAAAAEQATANLDARIAAANNKHHAVQQRVEARMDRKVSGVIDRLRAEMQDANGASRLAMYFRESDSSGDNRIDQDELKAFLFKVSPDAKARMNRAVDECEIVSKRVRFRFPPRLQYFGIKLSDKMAKRVMAEFDEDGDGEIDYQGMLSESNSPSRALSRAHTVTELLLRSLLLVQSLFAS